LPVTRKRKTFFWLPVTGIWLLLDMFSGLVEGKGVVKSKNCKGEVFQLEIETTINMNDLKIGDSIAVDGCCLTVTSKLGNKFWVDLGQETQTLTTLCDLACNDEVNLERALQMGARLGGHLVQGHVDGIGRIAGITKNGETSEYLIEIPNELAKYIVKKGSIAINGVSLTVNNCDDKQFSVLLIPHTLEATTLGKLRTGAKVNLEVDIIGKYVEKLTFISSDEYHAKSKITEEFLRKHGF
jgi:riboflavin synthase